MCAYICLAHRCKSGFIGFQPSSSLNNIQNKEDIRVRSSSPVDRFLDIIYTRVTQYPVWGRARIWCIHKTCVLDPSPIYT